MKRYLATSIFILTLLLGYFAFQNGFLFGVQELVPRPYPKLENPKNIVLSCDYKGQKLAIDETLYGSLYDYYRTEPKKMRYFKTDNNKSFIFNYEQDKTLDNITKDIVEIGKTKKLNQDQTLDLAACFTQSIPYDEVKAKKI